MNTGLHKWLRITVFNLLLVAFLGVVMRYKIAFSLPFINQKYLQNAHSHFAFAGWITQALMVFIALYIAKNSDSFSFRKYNYLLLGNLLTAYGMLFSFPFEGYGLISIIFSTLSIFISYAFAIAVWRDLNAIKKRSITHAWIRAGLIFSVLSSAGPYLLAYMMASKHIYQNIYLASVYYYLHFQYNGWFFFICMGLFADKLNTQLFSDKFKNSIFHAFAFACVPAYFLSALWLPVPTWLYAIIIIAAFMQVIAWVALLVKLISNYTSIFSQQPKPVGWLFTLSAIALTIKLLLQSGSTIPALSTWAFGFRPIVIGYLHLVFLGIFSIFILAYTLYNQYFLYNRQSAWGIWIFIAGIVVNELLLMAQGLDAITYTGVPYVNEMLLVAGGIMFTGLLVLNTGMQRIAQP